MLLGCFLGTATAGAWLGYAAMVVFGLAPSGPPRLSPVAVLAVAVLACALVSGAQVLVFRVAGAEIGPPARAVAEGRGARGSLLLSAAVSAFAVVFTAFAFGRISLLSLLPAALLAFLPALAAVRRGPMLRFAALCLTACYVLAGLAISLARVI